MRLRSIWTVIVASTMGGCGSSSTAPAAPTVPTVDISGTWTQVGAGTRTWTVSQSGIQAGGAATFSQDDHPDLGAVSGTGGVLGAVAFGSFRFAETYGRLSIPSRPDPNGCYMDTDGQLVISGDSMTGSYTEIVGCGGMRVSQVTRALAMQRK